MTGKRTTPECLELENAIAQAGLNKPLREAMFESLRQAESEANDMLAFRSQVRWPLILAFLRDVKNHRVMLENGLIFDVAPDSRIERAFLLSSSARPDHVWEPQTTKLLVAIGSEALNVIVGGAYIGDHVLLIARAMLDKNAGGKVHAFEPDLAAYSRLRHHLEINSLSNVISYQLGLWEKSDIVLHLEGDAALGSTVPAGKDDASADGNIRSASINDYVKSEELGSIGLIMLDVEGAEEKALLGASDVLSLPFPDAPHLIFEVHRNHIDWSGGLQNTSIIKYLHSKRYDVFAIRDFHDNYPMKDKPIEIIPIDSVYLEGPPHGFNLFATKDPNLITRLGLHVVKNVSPKLLLDKDPNLHHPMSGL